MNETSSRPESAESCGLVGLALTLPSRQPAARMRAWRALKVLGAAVLRDGLYVLPAAAAHEARLETLAAEIISAGGTAELLRLQARDREQAQRFRQLFGREAEFGGLRQLLQDLQAEAATQAGPALQRRLRALERQGEQIMAIDFFPGEAQAQWRRALADCRALLAPGEPQALGGEPGPLDRTAYQGRCWATRRRPWVDRLASAWLIARHIDAAARFLWLADPVDCPAGALGYDYDGAAFTHAGGRVSFETLLASFGLDGDAALVRLGGLVHALDVGGIPVAEASGVAALLAGACAAIDDDDALLAATLPVFDWLYRYHQQQDAR